MTARRRFYISEATAADTPVARLHARGAASLSDVELLSLFLRGSNTIERARTLLADAGSLRALLDRSPDALNVIAGQHTAALLLASLELSTRHLAHGLSRGEALTDPSRAGDYAARRLRGLEHEVFACLFLDTKHRVLAWEELLRGSLDSSEVHPREVVKRALALNAAAVIFAHNHPSGSAEPSTADRAVTTRLKQSLALVDVRVLDHFIIGDGAPCSMARLGAV